MADTKAALEKPSSHQFENAMTEKSPYSAECKPNETMVDKEGSSLGPLGFEDVDEAAVLRKMDIRLIPMLSMLYLLAFLDRGNIGNAKIEGLVDDLHMTGPQYNWTCMVSPCPAMLPDVKSLMIILSRSDCILFHLLCVRTAE